MPPMNPFILSSFARKLMGQPESDPYAIDQSLYQPGPGFNRYKEFIGNVPQRDQYQLGKGKNILAMLAGALTGFTSGPGAGIATTEALRNRPYNQAMQDYKIQAEGLGDVAALEERTQETKRKYRNDTLDALSKQEANQTARDRTEGYLSELDANSKARVSDLEIKRDSAKSQNERRRIQNQIDQENSRSNRIRARASEKNATTNAERTRTYKEKVENEIHNPKIAGQKFTRTAEDVISINPELADALNRSRSGQIIGYKVTDEDGQPINDPGHLAKVRKLRQLINGRLGMPTNVDTELGDVEDLNNEDDLEFIP